ncbi:precorrin-3B C(17)-methyltransferase [Paenochrobactrum gallinarii]
MERPMTLAPAILILGQASLETAKTIAGLYQRAEIWGLEGRVQGADKTYSHFGDTLRALYQEGRPLIALCASGIIIRALAPLLSNKQAEPPVLSIAEDGSAVVPLLGGLTGVNDMAKTIAKAFDVKPAITTSGELRFGINLLHPPVDMVLANPDAAKKFTSDLLAGAALRLIGQSQWIKRSKLPLHDDGDLTIRITPEITSPSDNELIYHPRTIVIGIEKPCADLYDHVAKILANAGLAAPSLALILAHEHDCNNDDIRRFAAQSGLPLRFVETEGALTPHSVDEPVKLIEETQVTIAIADTPQDIVLCGRPRGRLSVIGLGPGDKQFTTPAVLAELAQAQDLLGYETYIKMAGTLRDDQRIYATDNREEMQRARHAFELAASGRSVVMVSSGDPGVFAMATAVMEALDQSDNPSWHAVDLVIQPGISAAMSAASKAGAPLGHDFCIISLSDNLKPWSVIENRIHHAALADMVMAFYNPVSKARPHQLGQAIEKLRQLRTPETPVILARDIGRPAESLRHITLSELHSDMVDMRTVVLVGSSLTRTFDRAMGQKWTYTPRWYGDEHRPKDFK